MSGLIGQHIGQYAITGLLGKGGMATVYRARQSSIGRDVAFKVIRPDLTENTSFVTRFQREAQTVASLSHPHILKVFDYGQHGELVYLVMELLRGGSLAELISKGPLSPETTVRMIDQIASALDYAHNLGIIHRDLKPQNVLLDEQGNAFLTDFGIAKLLREATLTQSGVAMGTPAYMPPEQWEGRTLDGRADIYALGIMLFEMLAGKLPFNADTPFSMMHKHINEPPPSIHERRSGLPPGVEQVIKKALAKAPEQRYGSAGEFAAAFKAALTSPTMSTAVPVTEEPTVVGPVSEPDISGDTTLVKRGQPPRSRPILLIGGVIGALILIAGLLALFATRGGLATPTATDRPIPTQTTVSTLTATVSVSTSVPATAVAQAVTVPTNTPTGPTHTPSVTPSFTPSSTPVPSTATATVTNTATHTATAVPTHTPTIPTATLTKTSTKTPTSTPTERPNPATYAAGTFAARATLTAYIVASYTKTNTPTPSNTPNEAQTIVAMVAATDTAVAVASFTHTPTPTATNTPSDTPIPTATPTLTPTDTATATPTASDTPTSTFTPSNTATNTLIPTATASSTPTSTSTFTPSNTATSTPTPTYTASNTPTSTSTPTLTPSDTPTFTATYTPSATPTEIVLSPTPLGGGRGKIAFVSNRDGNLEIYVMDADSSNPTNVSRNIANDTGPAWSPDGRQIAFHSNRYGNDDIFVMDGDGSNLRRLTDDPADDQFPTWSPDGQIITFMTKRDGNWEIYAMEADGSNPVNLTHHGAADGSPMWSPDGKSIAFQSTRGREVSIYVMDPDGKNQRYLTSNTKDWYPAWSPDGKKIAFMSQREGGKGDIFVMNTDGSNPINLTRSPASSDSSPLWSPDGKHIVFQSDRDGNMEIYMMDANGKNQQNLTLNPARDTAPNWSP